MSSDMWDAYARLQRKLSGEPQVDDRSWGLEEGLNRLLNGDEDLMADAAARAVRSESRKERHHTRLRRLHLSVREQTGAQEVGRDTGHRPPVIGQHALEALCRVEERLDSRHRLGAAAQRLTADDQALLQAVAEGWDYDKISSVTRIRTGTLRVRVRRLRVALVALAA